MTLLVYMMVTSNTNEPFVIEEKMHFSNDEHFRPNHPIRGVDWDTVRIHWDIIPLC